MKRITSYRITIGILLTFAVLILSSCQKEHNVKSALAMSDSLMFEHPDSSYHILKKINRAELTSKYLQAYYALLLTEAKYKNYITIENDSLISIAVDYFKNKGDRKKYAESLMYKGAALNDMADYIGAIEAYKSSEEVMQPLNENLLSGLINTRMAELYNYLYVDDSIIINRYKLAANYYQKANDIRRLNNTYHYLFQSYIFTPYKDSANYYLDKSIELSKQINDSSVLLSNYYLLTYFYNKNGEYTKAKNIGLEVVHKWGNYNNANTINNLCVSYANIGQIDSARYYYNITSKEEKTSLSYLTLSKIEECAGNYKEALINSKISNSIADSIIDASTKQQVVMAEKRFDYNRIVAKNQIIKKQYNKIVFISISAVCILILICGIMWITIKNNKKELNSKLSLIEQLRNESDIAENAFINKLSHKDHIEIKLKEILEDKLTVLKKLADIAYMYENSDRALLREYKNIIRVGKLDKGLFHDIGYIVNIQHYGIIDYINNEYPNLNKEDLNFISLLCCDFATSTICAFYGYKTNDVAYVKKYRLSQKMKLKTSIEKYIESVKIALQESPYVNNLSKK